LVEKSERILSQIKTTLCTKNVPTFFEYTGWIGDYSMNNLSHASEEIQENLKQKSLGFLTKGQDMLNKDPYQR
jgi:hypothetical protein